MKRILVLEDDLALNAGLCFELDGAGYCSVGAYNCGKALQILENDKLDLAILDVNLPDGSGFDVCREAKRLCPELPVIFLTANDLEENELTGFDLGAEDYVTKPFRTSVLLRRVEVALRKTPGHKASGEENLNGYDDGFLRIDFERLEVLCKGEKLSVTPNEYKILKLLIANSGQIITRESMLEKLWGNDGCFINDHTLTVVINRLRGKLERKEQTYIQTIRGIGYAWNGNKT